MITQRLPPELIERIAELLPRRDLHQCILVSRTLNATLIPLLYRTIFVTTAANGFNSMTRVNGEFVRRLVVEDDVLPPEGIQTLCSLCPNLTELEYNWPNKDTAHTTSGRSDFPRSPPLLLQYMVNPKRLTGLQLCYHESQQYVQDVPIAVVYEFFFRLLRHLPPRLRSLSLVGLLPILRLTDLEAIHTACPSLTHLTVEGSNMVLRPKNQVTTCHPNLKSLRIAYPSGWSQVSQWIHLIFTRYPSIEVLELVNTSSVCNVLRPLAADARLNDVLVYPRHLSELRLLKLGAYNLECMMPLTHLHALTDVDIQSDRDWDMVTWLEAICDRIKRLSFTFPRTNKDKVLQTLAKFRHLTDLALVITSTLSLSNFFLWGCPPSLRRLTIRQGYISYDTEQSEDNARLDNNIVLSSTMTHLALRNVSVASREILAIIVAGCPLLSTIETFGCIWILALTNDRQEQQQQKSIEFDFGQRQLNFLSMTASSIADSQEIQMHEIQCYEFDLSSSTTTEAPVEIATVQRTGCKRIRDIRGQQQTPLLVVSDKSTQPQLNNHTQKIRRKTGLDTYTVVGGLKEALWSMTVKCKNIRKICINGNQL